MSNLRLLAVVSLIGSAAAVGSLAACSDDTTLNPTDGGTPDVIVNEASTLDTGVDTGIDASDSGSDAGVTLSNIADTLAEHLCNAFARCCYGTANPADGGIDGGGSFNRAQCLSVYQMTGFENSSVGHGLYPVGHVSLDQAKANECVSDIDTLSCAALSGATLQGIRATCFAAVVGSIPSGQPCAQSVECSSGLFCKPTDATVGLAGTCTALQGDGDSCDLFDTASDSRDSNFSEEACSYRGGGSPPLRCDSVDPIDTSKYLPESEWTCKAGAATGESCNGSVDCANGLCDPDTFRCVDMREYFTASLCTMAVTH